MSFQKFTENKLKKFKTTGTVATRSHCSKPAVTVVKPPLETAPGLKQTVLDSSGSKTDDFIFEEVK